MESSLNRLIEAFPANPVASGKFLQRLLLDDPRQFFLDALPVLRMAPDTPGFYYVLALLHSQNLVLKNLCDPALFTKQESISLAKRMARVEPLFDMKLAKMLLATEAKPGAEEPQQAGMRLLEIMAEASDRGRSLLLAQLLHHPSAQVRSKAALLVGKSTKDVKWVSQRMNEPDSRIRANAIEALWGVESEECRRIFLDALDDPANRVVGNGVLGLYRLGVPEAIGSILTILTHPDDGFRKTGLWLVGESRDLRFLPVLARLMRESTPALRPFVFRAFAKLKQRRSALAALPALRVHVLPGSLSEGWKGIDVVVFSPTGLPVSGLKSIQFALWEKDDLILEYRVRAVVQKEPVAVAFAMPRNTGAPETQGPYERALVDCLSAKRKLDAWIVLQYCPSEAAESVGLQDDLLPELRFGVEAAALEKEIQSRKSRLSSAGSLMYAAGSLMPALSRGRGRRHLILLDDGSSWLPDTGQLQQILDAAKLAEITIHGIGQRETALRNLCAQTGGRWLHAPGDDSVAELLTGLYASLTSGYQVRYRGDEAPVDLRVEVCTDQGLGEATLRA